METPYGKVHDIRVKPVENERKEQMMTDGRFKPRMKCLKMDFGEGYVRIKRGLDWAWVVTPKEFQSKKFNQCPDWEAPIWICKKMYIYGLSDEDKQSLMNAYHEFAYFTDTTENIKIMVKNDNQHLYVYKYPHDSGFEFDVVTAAKLTATPI